MKKLLLFVLAIIAILLFAAANGQNQTVTQNGRYQIVINTEVRADTFLLDTQTGRTWKPIAYTDIKGSPTVWKYQDKVDNYDQLMQWGKEAQLEAETKSQ